DPGGGPASHASGPGLRTLSRTKAVHDPRSRSVVGRRDPADAEVRQPAPDDVGVVAQAAAGKPAALHADARPEQGDLRVGLAGIAHAPGDPRGARPGSASRGARQLSLQQRTGILFRTGALTMDRFELRRLDYSLSDDQADLQTAYKQFFKTHCSIETVRAAEPSGFDKSLWERLCAMGATTMALPESCGGDGATLVDLSLVAEEVGRSLAPVPWIDHVCA